MTIQPIDQAMVERAGYIGPETTKGTFASPTVGLGAMAFSEPADQYTTQAFAPPGELYDTAIAVGAQHTTGSMSGYIDYRGGIYAWAGLLNAPTTTDNGDGTYTHKFGVNPRGKNTPKTFTACWGDETYLTMCRYLFMTEFGIEFVGTDSAFPVNGSWTAQQQLRDKLRYIDVSNGASGNITIQVTTKVKTKPIAYNASAGDIEAALNALINIGTNGVSVAAATDFDVTFDGTVFATIDVPELKVVDDTTVLGTGTGVTISSAAPSPDEVQTIALNGADSGTYRLEFEYTHETATITATDTAANIKSALEALPLFADGDVEVGGGALGTSPVYVILGGRWARRSAPTWALGTSGLTGTATITRLAPDINDIDPQPILIEDTSLYIAETHDELVNTAPEVERLFSGSISESGKRNPGWPIQRQRGSFKFDVALKPGSEVVMKVGLGEADDLQNRMEKGDKVFVRLWSLSEFEVVEGTGVYFEQIVDCCVQITAVGAISDENGVATKEFTCSLARDASWKKVIEVEMTNDIAAL
jgi:hypothetical protein